MKALHSVLQEHRVSVYEEQFHEAEEIGLWDLYKKTRDFFYAEILPFVEQEEYEGDDGE